MPHTRTAVIRHPLTVAATAVLLIGSAVGRTRSAGQSPASAGLDQFFKPGTVFQDRNRDGVVDFVDAQIVVAARPAPGELTAAADVAARLGFETSAMNLPLSLEHAGTRSARDHSSPAVFVGAGSLAGSGATVDALGGGSLKPGDGLVAAFNLSGHPAVALLGDETGVRAAAVAFAGRMPYLTDAKGPTVDQVADDLKDFLSSRGVKPASVFVPAIYTHANAEGVDRLVVDAQMASGGDVVKAEVALNQLKATGGSSAKRALSYGSAGVLRIRLRAAGGAFGWIDLPRAAATAQGAAAQPGQPPAPRPGSGPKDNLDLSNFYSIEGALGDSDSNLIPDRVDALISPSGDGTDAVVSLAARLGLESTGVSIPIAKPAMLVSTPESEPTLVLVGTSHPALDQLAKSNKWERPALEPGAGLIQIVKKAFGEKSAVVVTGADAAGVNRAVRQLAERFPHIWSRGKDRTTLDDVEEDVRKFLAGRTPSGQASMALYKLDRIGRELEGRQLQSANVKVFVEKAATGLADVVRKDAAAKIHANALNVAVQDMDVRNGRALISEDFEIPSEVDEFWTTLRSRVLPGLKKHPAVKVEARLSEPPEVRRQIEQQARAELLRAGADEKATSVTVLSAYKQGYSWLYDVVRPELSGKPIEQITIRFAEIGAPAGWKQEGMYAPTRWLLELYPIDEILANELKIDLRKIRFERAPIGSPAYELVATAPGGAQILRQTFEPKVADRVFFDRFPDYEHVRVTTGWIRAEVAGRAVADERIETDPERFWDHFQSRTLPALYDHVMALGNGKPRAEDAPFFGELTVDLSLSEPDYRIPVDQEQISSMEALHEEIYFNTLHFFDLMGRFTRGAPLIYPGRVIPVMHPKADGKPGRARITLTGFDVSRPSVIVEYVEKNGHRGEIRLDVPKIAVDRPQALAAVVGDGRDGIDELQLRVKVDTQKDERDQLVLRAAEERVDRTIISAEQVTAVVANLERLRAAGLYRDALAYHDLNRLRITAGWQHESKPASESAVTLTANGSPAPFPDIRALLPQGWRYEAASGAAPSTELVQWNEPIPPPEANEILAKMSTFKEARVYKVGESYLGRDIWAMDLMPPIEASHWSQAKATTLKPTVVYSARQHANEVSSTSHTLKLAELLLTDPAYREKLNKVNVVFHPITNADGAQLAYDLQKITPTHMLHAAYLGSLGVDVTAAQWDPDPIYPESGIRPKIWRTWLPDIFLNPHGYPTHEWVQLFSEYAAWVRTRAVETRDYWTMRGWWMPGFGWLDDPKYPRHQDAQMKLLQTITEFAKAAPGTLALNERAYARYKRYGFDFDQKNFKLDFTNGVLIYKAIKGARANPQSPDFMTRQPNVTIWDGSTEAPDETAHGDWLKLVATAGLQWDKAILEYLVDERYEIERKVEPFWGGVSLGINRPRPPKPAKAEEKKPTTEHQP